jgi:hypothetical protein
LQDFAGGENYQYNSLQKPVLLVWVSLYLMFNWLGIIANMNVAREEAFEKRRG